MHGSSERPGDTGARHEEAGGMPTEQQSRHLAWPEAVCHRIEPLLEAFHDGALSAADERLVREHVASCARCIARLRSYDEIDTVLRLAPAPRVGSELRTRLYTRIAATQQRRGILAVFGSGSGHKQVGGGEAMRRTRSYRRSGSRRAEARRAFGGGRPGLVTGWINGMAAIAVVLLLVLLFNTLTGMPYRAGTSGTPTSRGKAIAALSGLPKFSDYRAAYLDDEGRVRIVAANGQASIGPTLPNTGLLMRTPAASYYDVAVSQNGQYLAYVEGDASVRDAATPLPSDGPVAIVNLITGTTLSMPIRANDLSWSPDNRLLVAPDVSNFTDINIIDAITGISRQLVVSFKGAQAYIPLVAGWIDSTHIAVFYQHGGSTPTPTQVASAAPQPTGSLQQSLGSIDIHSGAITYLADLPDPSDVFLSPDGKEVLLAPNYSTAMAQVVDTRTGQTSPLPNISQAFAGKFADLGAGGNWSLHSAWQPGAGHVLALSLAIDSSSSSASQEPGVWLLDLDHDSATRMAANAYPLAWFPQSSQALVTCDPPRPDSTGAYPMDGAGVGSTLYTLAPVERSGNSSLLASSMVAFLGLVRTA